MQSILDGANGGNERGGPPLCESARDQPPETIARSDAAEPAGRFLQRGQAREGEAMRHRFGQLSSSEGCRCVRQQFETPSLVLQQDLKMFGSHATRRWRPALGISQGGRRPWGPPRGVRNVRSPCISFRTLPFERAVARVSQEAGARVARNVRLADMNLLTPVHDARRIEIVCNGLTLWHGAQLAVDTTLVSPLTRAGEARPGADSRPATAIRDAAESA